MIDAERYKLLQGRYRPPRCRMGSVLFCELRGDVVFNGMSAGRIAWPTTRKGRARPAFILCGDLVKAVQRESATAICYWWGVTAPTVTKWRKVLRLKTWLMFLEKQDIVSWSPTGTFRDKLALN